MKNIMNWHTFNENFFGGFSGRDCIELGPVPSDENSVQVSKTEDYMPAMRAECQRYLDMLEKRFPNCDKVSLEIKSNPHEFGTYLEVAAYYSDDEGERQAIFIEKNTPYKWTDTEVLTYVPSEDEEDDEFDEFAEG